MSAIYLDSSAIVKLIIAAPESAALRKFLRRRRPLVTSALARTEVTRAVLREGEPAIARVRVVLDRIDLMRVNDRVLEAAGLLLPVELGRLMRSTWRLPASSDRISGTSWATTTACSRRTSPRPDDRCARVARTSQVDPRLALAEASLRPMASLERAMLGAAASMGLCGAQQSCLLLRRRTLLQRGAAPLVVPPPGGVRGLGGGPRR